MFFICVLYFKKLIILILDVRYHSNPIIPIIDDSNNFCEELFKSSNDLSFSATSMSTSMVSPSTCSKLNKNNNNYYLNHFHQHPNHLFKSYVVSNDKTFENSKHSMVAYNENLNFSNYPNSFIIDQQNSLTLPVSERRKFFERVAEYNTSF